jgi:tRNA pseudouridine55 synthase
MDGLLVIDKPAGPTSHDVVARMRRALGESRIGHTGTLDPMASGVLPLVIGRATRLAQFLSASDKHYEAVVRLGVSTDTCDALGRPLGEPYAGPLPGEAEIERALEGFRGSFQQQPPSFSAKKIGGKRSYKLARDRARQTDAPAPQALPAPVTVSAHSLDLIGLEGAYVSLSLTCSAGFYVRALAYDLGQALGTGGHLSALRRTRSGALTLADAITLDRAEREPTVASACVLPLRALLPELPSAVLTADGVRHAGQGRELDAHDLAGKTGEGPEVRLLDGGGELVGIARPGRSAGLLHPSIVLM